MSDEDCFIERERFLETFPDKAPDDPSYYANIFSELLNNVSTPIDENDIFVGRIAEGAPIADREAPNKIIFAKGHMTPDYQRLLSLGYKRILNGIKENASKINTENAYRYAVNAQIVIYAIYHFSLRYAEAAKKCGNIRAYKALLHVPYEPAYDLFSALQAIWVVHMIASGYVGGRDYAFGYMDEYLYPYYLQEKENGTTDEEIQEMLAGFFIKANEICGRCTHNYKVKPVMCKASKQYVLLDGGRANELSERILDAASAICMAQPQFTVVLSDNAPESFQNKVYEAMSVMTDKLHIYHYDPLPHLLRHKNLPEDIAIRPAYSACCTFDLNWHSCREEFYLPTVQLFCDTLNQKNFSSMDELLEVFATAVSTSCLNYIKESRTSPYDETCVFVMDTLLLGECNETCECPPSGLRFRAKNIFLPGLATLGDSISALDALVFHGDICYDKFLKMLNADFVGYEAIHEKILSLPKFGNDDGIDRYTVRMANLLIDAVENVSHLENEILLPSFYSLERDNVWAYTLPATPDGRKAGTPISENQSPTYGADKSGMTALLNSLSKIPFGRTAAGGLNLTFSSSVKPNILKALVKTYFAQGGLHIGITVLDRNTLLDAMKHPERYPTLTVRLYGFSEYFVSLPEWQQLAVLNRTAY